MQPEHLPITLARSVPSSALLPFSFAPTEDLTRPNSIQPTHPHPTRTSIQSQAQTDKPTRTDPEANRMGVRESLGKIWSTFLHKLRSTSLPSSTESHSASRGSVAPHPSHHAHLPNQRPNDPASFHLRRIFQSHDLPQDHPHHHLNGPSPPRGEKSRESRDYTSERIVVDQGLASSNEWSSKFASCGINGYMSSQSLIGSPTAEAEDHAGEKQSSPPDPSSQAYQAYRTSDQFFEALEQGRLEPTSSTSSRPTRGADFRATGLRRVRWAKDRTWKAVLSFFDSTFMTEKEERLFQKEAWYVNPEQSSILNSIQHLLFINLYPVLFDVIRFQDKRSSLYGSSFFVLNWLTTMAFSPRPFDIINKITIYGIAPVLWSQSSM